MKGGLSDLVDDFRAGLIEEAGEARRLSDRIRAVDFEVVDSGPPMREVERELDDYSRQLLGIDAALQIADAPSEGAPALSRRWHEARAARRASWEALARSLVSLAGALESQQGARAIDRMRLVESLRALARESAATQRLSSRMAELHEELQRQQAAIRTRDEELAGLRSEITARDEVNAELRSEVARLEAILNEEGHLLVTRLGAKLARHPTMAAIVRAPVRLLSRLMGRSAR